jgi:hypothetical protein
MPFQLVAVKQAKSFSLTGQASPLSLSFDSSVAAGSTIVVIGSAIESTDQAALLGTVSGGSATWGSATNTRSAGDFLPNVCAAVGVNVSAGSPTFTIPFTTNGVASTNFRFTGMLIEVEKVPTSGVVANTSTSATGTLAQTDNLVILCAGGWFGVPVNPAGYTERLNVQNGSFIGCHVSTKKVTATTTQTGTVNHDTAPAASAIMLVLKAADDAAFLYEFLFPATGTGSMPSAQGTIRAVVSRNRDPFTTGTYEYYSSLTAESGTAPGDATSRRVLITSGLPAGLSVSDTLRASFETADASTGAVGWIPGTVKAV